MDFDFSRIEEIRLSPGPHTSPEEGVCFYEAVAFFAGEPHSDRPACACPVLTAYGIRLNDAMPDDVRNRLLRPLVPLVAGTRDRASEQKRGTFLAMLATNKILPIVLRERGFADHADACEKASDLSEAKIAANAAAYAANAAANAAAANASAAAYAANAAAAYAANAAANADAADAAAAASASAYAYAANAANADAANADAEDEIWTVAVEGLKQAILIGRHDGFAVPAPVLAERHEALRALLPAA